jgi:CelD/BcsL family acetyltransferase involved in cellulose biosynthesis
MQAQPCEFGLVRTMAGLTALELEWKQLHSKSEPSNPFLSYDWTLACWAIREQGAELFVVTARSAGRLVGIAPMCIERRSGLRILRFIADDRSDYLGFLLPREIGGIEQILLEQLMTLEDKWDLAIFQRLADTYTRLHHLPAPEKTKTHQTQWTSAPFCTWEGDWESFHKRGPSWLREMRKRSRRFLRDGCTAQCFTGVEALGRLDSISQIEAQSWKGRHGTARLQPGTGQELLRRAFQSLGSTGEMQLWLAFVEQRAVAFQVDFVLRDRLWHYQCAYDEDFRRSRAGSVLTYLSMESAWKRGIKEFDYLSGEEPYKLERTNASRPIYHLAAHRDTPRGWLAYALLLAPRWHLRKIRAFRFLYTTLQALRHGSMKRSHD